jgi:hypothetical protein
MALAASMIVPDACALGEREETRQEHREENPRRILGGAEHQEPQGAGTRTCHDEHEHSGGAAHRDRRLGPWPAEPAQHPHDGQPERGERAPHDEEVPVAEQETLDESDVAKERLIIEHRFAALE